MEFSRITSGFTLARFHPILQTWRAHKGIDFAAPNGTPVRATGDGDGHVRRRQNGYGNVVILRHEGATRRLRASVALRAADDRPARACAQGDMIGYVGQTGWATGPHLHYEFRVDGEPRDPLTSRCRSPRPSRADERAAFAAQIEPLEPSSPSCARCRTRASIARADRRDIAGRR